ncbi:hypothetical protein [Methanoculleus chikugoensis]|uniref:hypothetical protein n=1 Tax=Methanoculleus chikugoensis TaxID=118126 RepID=UPI001FB31354|nr:hypothetical protein [Methanoculleus chikugoensis]
MPWRSRSPRSSSSSPPSSSSRTPRYRPPGRKPGGGADGEAAGLIEATGYEPGSSPSGSPPER